MIDPIPLMNFGGLCDYAQMQGRNYFEVKLLLSLGCQESLKADLMSILKFNTSKRNWGLNKLR